MARDPSELARALGALQRRVMKVCAHCGKEYEGLTKSKYCGPNCVMAAYRERNREELNRKRREKYQRQKAAKQ